MIGRVPNFGSRDFRWKGAITRHRISRTWPAKTMRKQNGNHNGAAPGGAPGAGDPWGCGFCCAFASLRPAMCSKSLVPCYGAPLFGTRTNTIYYILYFIYYMLYDMYYIVHTTYYVLHKEKLKMKLLRRTDKV